MRLLRLDEITREDLASLAKSLEGDTDQLLRSFLNGSVMLWKMETEQEPLRLVTRILDKNGESILQVTWGGGEGAVKNLDRIDQVLTEFARLQGCIRIQCFGKPGLAKLAPRVGARVKKVLIEKEID